MRQMKRHGNYTKGGVLWMNCWGCVGENIKVGDMQPPTTLYLNSERDGLEFRSPVTLQHVHRTVFHIECDAGIVEV